MEFDDLMSKYLVTGIIIVTSIAFIDIIFKSAWVSLIAFIAIVAGIIIYKKYNEKKSSRQFRNVRNMKAQNHADYYNNKGRNMYGDYNNNYMYDSSRKYDAQDKYYASYERQITEDEYKKETDYYTKIEKEKLINSREFQAMYNEKGENPYNWNWQLRQSKRSKNVSPTTSQLKELTVSSESFK